MPEIPPTLEALVSRFFAPVILAPERTEWFEAPLCRHTDDARRMEQLPTNQTHFHALVNHLTGEYAYFSPSISTLLGVDVENFYRGGMFYLIKNFVHPRDAQVLFQDVYPALYRTLGDVRMDQRRQIHARYSFRLRTHNDTWMRLKHDNVVLEVDDHGMPLLSFALGVFTEACAFDSDEPIHALIRCHQSDDQFITLFEQSFPVVRWAGVKLSKRERQVLRLLAQGQDEQLSTTLNVSEQMVQVHRRTLMRKFQTDDEQEMLRLSYMAGLVE